MDKLDSWDIDRDGITYQVALYSDDDSNRDPVNEGDNYTAEDVAAHDRGDWQFVGVVVTPLVGGQVVEAAADSLWSVEYGSNPGRWLDAGGRDQVVDREYITNVHPVPEMIREVRGNLAKLGSEITRLNLG
jgi:hypothetical protein